MLQPLKVHSGQALLVVAADETKIDRYYLATCGMGVTGWAHLNHPPRGPFAFCMVLHFQGPFIPMIRRHTKGDKEIHFEPALTVVSGNYVTAKRRGVVDGTDFGLTGEVRG